MGKSNPTEYCKAQFDFKLSKLSTSKEGNLHTENSCPLVEVRDDSRSYIPLKVFGLETVALFDTGATSPIIGHEGIHLIYYFNLETSPPNFSKVIVANRSEQEVVGIVYVPLCINDNCQLVKMLVVPSIYFARQFKLTVDFDTNVWNMQTKRLIDLVSEEDTTVKIPQLISYDNLDENQRIQANTVVKLCRKISSTDKLGRTNRIKMNIDTGDSKPIRKKQYPISPYMLKTLNSELDELLKLGDVRES